MKNVAGVKNLFAKGTIYQFQEETQLIGTKINLIINFVLDNCK